MSITFSFKRGDTFKLSCQYQENNAAAPLPPGIRSQLRDSLGNLIAELTVTRTDQDGGLYVLSFGDTSTWPIARLRGDIQYTDAQGNIFSVPGDCNYYLNVVEDVTHD
jgi:hypothetical protein